MKIEKLACNCCGAPLEVPSTANFVNCNHCSTQLTIRRTDNVTFTEQLEQLSSRTEELSDRIDNLTGQNEVAALDREWEFERKKYMIDSSNGRHLPRKSDAVGSGVTVGCFGALWTVMAIAITSSAPDMGPFVIAKFVFPLFGLGFVGFGITSSISAYQKAEKYEAAEKRYRAKREELLNSPG